MKKMLFVAVAALAMVSCANVDKNLDKLEAAVKAKDCAKILKVNEKLAKQADKFTPEQTKRLAGITAEFASTGCDGLPGVKVDAHVNANSSANGTSMDVSYDINY